MIICSVGTAVTTPVVTGQKAKDIISAGTEVAQTRMTGGSVTLSAMLIICAAASGTAGFTESLSVRDFDTAMELAAGSDSLSAVVLRAAGADAAAAALLSSAFRTRPSAPLLSLMWEAIASDPGHGVHLQAGLLREALQEWGGRLTWEPPELLSLAGSSASLGDSVLADSLTRLLILSHPSSEEAFMALAGEFYGNLYPVWNDDSSMILVLDDFIAEWGAASDHWRSTAWRYRLSSLLETPDSSAWRSCLDDWLESCPHDPRARLSGAGLLIERDSAFAEALWLADEGLDLFGRAGRPSGMPEGQWLLTAASMEAGLHHRRLQALAGTGSTVEALSDLEDVISKISFHIDDHSTAASLHCLRGDLMLAAGDTTEALDSYAEAAILGDTHNRWAASAEEAMKSILPNDMTPVEWARAHRNYTGPVFLDMTELLGPDSVLRGTRVSWCDYDRDGRPDLFAGSTLFRNTGGASFEDVTSQAGLDGCRGNGGVWGDIDHGGFPDLVTSGDPVQVFLNRNGVFEEATDGMGVGRTEGSAEGVALVDWNADGWLDLYVASYEKGLGEGTSDLFFLGGREGFREAGDSIGMVPFLGRALCGRGVSPCDFDRDGDMDIFVSNYRLQENLLWENENGRASGTALPRGVAGTNDGGWWGHTIGSAWGDFDNDGDWDLFCANLAHPRYIEFSDGSMLLENEGGTFTDVRAEAGIRFEETHSSPVWGDFDNDGWLDLYVTSVYPDRRSFLYRNRGDGTFEDVTWLSGARVLNGWGAASADFNTDGRLDLAVGSGDGPVLFMNTTAGGSWVLVEVIPPAGCNPSGIGCTVVLEQDGLLLLRQVEGGSGTSCQNGAVLHFGLPEEAPFTLKLHVPGTCGPVGELTATPRSIVRIGGRG